VPYANICSRFEGTYCLHFQGTTLCPDHGDTSSPQIVGYQRMADQMLLARGVGVSGAVRLGERMIKVLKILSIPCSVDHCFCSRSGDGAIIGLLT
jgi:hypothetical protein